MSKQFAYSVITLLYIVSFGMLGTYLLNKSDPESIAVGFLFCVVCLFWIVIFVVNIFKIKR